MTLTKDGVRMIVRNINSMLYEDFNMKCWFSMLDDELCIIGEQGRYYTYIRTRDVDDFIRLISQDALIAAVCDGIDPESQKFNSLILKCHIRFEQKEGR